MGVQLYSLKVKRQDLTPLLPLIRLRSSNLFDIYSQSFRPVGDILFLTRRILFTHNMQKDWLPIRFLISFLNKVMTAFLTYRSYSTSMSRNELATAKGTQSLARSYNYAVA